MSFAVLGSRFSVRVSGFGFGFRVQGSGFRVQGSGSAQGSRGARARGYTEMKAALVRHDSGAGDAHDLAVSTIDIDNG